MIEQSIQWEVFGRAGAVWKDGLTYQFVEFSTSRPPDRAGMRSSLPTGHAWRILRQLGWSCQHPTGRALERDEEKIREWKQRRWPEI